jgi:hypothetical protein
VKLSLSRAWDETKAVLAADARLIGAVALAFLVLPGIVLRVVAPDTPPNEFPPFGPWVAVLIAVLLISFIGQVAIARMAMEPHISVGEAVAVGTRRLAALFGAFLVWTVPLSILAAVLYSLAALSPTSSTGVALIALILLCVLTIFAIFLVIRLILVPAVAASEGGNPVELLRRSVELTRGNWWRLFAFILLYALAAGILLGAVESVVGLVAGTLLGETTGFSIGNLVIGLAVQLISAIVSVGFFVMLARIYVQLSGRESVEVGVPKSGT